MFSISTWASSWENVSSWVCDQVRLNRPAQLQKLAWGLKFWLQKLETLHYLRNEQQRRWLDCAGWSAPLLFAYDIRHVFSWPGSRVYNLLCFTLAQLSRLITKKKKMTVRQAKTKISLGIRPVWSESSLCAQWVAKDPSFLHAGSEDSDHTGRMPRLIWVFAGSTCYFVGFVMRRLNWPDANWTIIPRLFKISAK